MDAIISLRDYINRRDEIESIKIRTFCRLMKMVSEAIEKEQRPIIKINLDDIKINITNGEIILSDDLFKDPELDKTIVGFNTGISLIADRKASQEQKSVAFALMVLGWYYNEDGSAIINDLDVLENFDLYISKVPSWLHDFFINIFRKMDYNMSFADYYKINFIDKIEKDIKEAFAPYKLNEEQFRRISSLVAKETNRMIKEGDLNV